MVTDEMLKAVAAKYMFESLTAEDREKMPTSALEKLISEPHDPGNYRDKRSRLQWVFDTQLSQLANEIVREWLRQPEHKARVAAALSVVIDKLLASDDFVERVASKMTAGLWSD